MSLLRANGHPDACRYPLGMVWDEAQLVVERLNAMATTEAVLIQMAVSSLFSKEAGRQFRKLLADLNDV